MFRPFIVAWKKSALTQVCCAMVTPIAAMETMNERATLTWVCKCHTNRQTLWLFFSWSDWTICPALDSGKTCEQTRTRDQCVDSNLNMAALHKCNDMGGSLDVKSCTCLPNDPFPTIKPPTKPTTEKPTEPTTDDTTTYTNTTPDTTASPPTNQCTNKIFWSCKAKAYPNCWFCCWWVWFILVLLLLVSSRD